MSRHPVTNLKAVHELLRILDRPADSMKFVVDRPGHDCRYALDTRKILREMNWSAEVELQEGLARAVEWYRTHPD